MQPRSVRVPAPDRRSRHAPREWRVCSAVATDAAFCNQLRCGAVFSHGIRADVKEEYKSNAFELYDETRIFHVSAMHRCAALRTPRACWNGAVDASARDGRCERGFISGASERATVTGAASGASEDPDKRANKPRKQATQTNKQRSKQANDVRVRCAYRRLQSVFLLHEPEDRTMCESPATRASDRAAPRCETGRAAAEVPYVVCLFCGDGLLACALLCLFASVLVRLFACVFVCSFACLRVCASSYLRAGLTASVVAWLTRRCRAPNRHRVWLAAIELRCVAPRGQAAADDAPAACALGSIHRPRIRCAWAWLWPWLLLWLWVALWGRLCRLCLCRGLCVCAFV